MSSNGPRFAAGLLLAAAAVSAGAPSGAWADKSVAYRWVDDQGVVHYGDRVPPQYAQKERSVINAQGVEVRTLDAQKTPEQAAAEERQRQEAIKVKQHDNFLLTTYTSIKDIEALRDERLDQLKAQRTAAELYVETIHSRLTSLQARAMGFRPYSDKPSAHRLPDDLAEDLVRTLNEMRTQNSALLAKGAEESLLRSQFQTDIERYRALHAQPAPQR